MASHNVYAKISPDFKSIDEEALNDKDRLDRAYSHAKSEKLLPAQQEVLNAYINHYVSKSLAKPVSICNSLQLLKTFGEHVYKPFLDVTEADIEEYFISLKRRDKPLKQRSIISKNVAIKHFYRWLYDRAGIKYEGDYPALVKELSTKVPKKTLQTSELITQQEVRQMIEACIKRRDKAIISMLYESGARAGELCGLKIKDLKIESECIELNIRISKTEPRTVFLINSYLYLLDYLNEHPYKHEPEAPLLINASNAQFGRSIRYQGLDSIVRTAKKRAGLKKRITLHLFRHSRATELAAKGWTEMQLRKWFGWSSTSGTPSIYVHIGRADVKKKVLKEHGLLSDDETLEEMNEKAALQEKECPSCGRKNPPDSLACNCGRALTYASVEEIRKLKADTDGFIDKLNQTPLKAGLVEDGMSQLEYKKKLVTSDPFLKAEFQKIVREVMGKMEAKRKAEQQTSSGGKTLGMYQVKDKYKDEVLKLKKEGWTLNKIARELGIGYGTVQKICSS